jgi:DNA helicase-2/ATP-dependent DNA helicase PcrA
MTDSEQELQRLENVRSSIKLQFTENEVQKDTAKSDLIEYRRFMWEEYPHEKEALSDNTDYNQLVEESHKSEADYERITTLQNRLKSLYLSPYFARIDFLEDGERFAEQIYIGKSSFLDEKTMDMLVYDWRAPISSMFYDYENGRAEYTCPDGIIKGEMPLKRQYIIENGKLISMFDCSIAIEDEMLQRVLAGTSEDKMKNIVTTIQREQNKAVRDEKSDVLIVSGSAGSGKTSVALHRISYLLYHHRQTLNEKNILIFSPNDVFNEYISDVLPSLGEKNVLQTTFNDFADKTISRKKQSYFEYLEQLLNGGFSDERFKSIKIKGSAAFTEFIENYVSGVREKGIDFKDINNFDETVMTSDEMLEIFKNCHKFFGIEQCIDKVKMGFHERTKEEMKKRIPILKEQCIEEKGISYYLGDEEITRAARTLWYQEFLLLDAEFENKNSINCYNIYRKILSLYFENDSTTFQRDCILFEDIAPVLYIKFLTGQIKPIKDIRHMIIDEAQDYNYLQFRILSRLFINAKFTVLGDVNQVINADKPRDFEYIKAAFNNKTVDLISLNKSYRSTVEINEYARKILNKTDAECILRHGETPTEMVFDSNDKKLDFLFSFAQQAKAKYSTTAIITKTKEQAIELYNSLSEKTDFLQLKPKLIADNDAIFTKGILIMPSYLSKGLEFDCVIVDAESEFDSNLLYICCSRALHRLVVIKNV